VSGVELLAVLVVVDFRPLSLPCPSAAAIYVPQAAGSNNTEDTIAGASALRERPVSVVAGPGPGCGDTASRASDRPGCCDEATSPRSAKSPHRGNVNRLDERGGAGGSTVAGSEGDGASSCARGLVAAASGSAQTKAHRFARTLTWLTALIADDRFALALSHPRHPPRASPGTLVRIRPLFCWEGSPCVCRAF
jgi:hypothetical protein